MLKHEAAITEYLRAHPDGATLKAMSIDLEITSPRVHHTLRRMPTVWIDRWTRGQGRMAAVYKVVPLDAPKPAAKGAK